MSPTRPRIAAALLPVLLFALRLTVLTAQEIPHPEVPHESDASHDTSANQKSQDDLGAEAKKGFEVKLAPGEELVTNEEGRIARLHSPPIEIHWKTDPSGKGQYAPYRIVNGQQVPLNGADILALYHGDTGILHTGIATQDPAWHKFTAEVADRTFIHEEDSANRSDADVDWAMQVAVRPLDPAKTKIFTALPQQTSPRASAAERQHMNIGGRGEAWAELNGRIEKSRGKFPPAQVATKTALLHEFGQGTSDVILVYAHFDGDSLRMPDADGNPGAGITMKDIADLAGRPNAKDRVIVLVACETAKASPGASSIVSLLLKKRLARAVLATAFPYDAQHIPAFLRNLSAGVPPGAADPQLRHYVELDLEKIWDELRFSPRPANEVTFNG